MCSRGEVCIQAGAYPSFWSMKRLGVFLLPPGWDASPSQDYPLPPPPPPSIKFACTHLYTWAERGTVRFKCHAQEHNTMPPARARTRTAPSGVECTNHRATVPPTNVVVSKNKKILSLRNFGVSPKMSPVCGPLFVV